MIYVAGEILADRFQSAQSVQTKLGGAPFNVAVWATECGSDVVFYGAVGDDDVGKVVLSQAKKTSVKLNVDVEVGFKTTVALVSVDENGERNFRFLRDNTAEFNLFKEKMDICAFEKCTIAHLGSLMLTTEQGRNFAADFVDMAKACGKILSFDYNFRDDLYDSFADSKQICKKIVEVADVLKFSEDEILAYTNESDVFAALKLLSEKGKLVIATLGKNGSAYSFGDVVGTVSAASVKVVDTTGAGDAYMGATLAGLDKTDFPNLTANQLEQILKTASEKGAEATTFYGAINI